MPPQPDERGSADPPPGDAGLPADSELAAARARMVERHIGGRDVTDPGVLRAMGSVQREAFIPPDLARYAYEDRPLPIAKGQTISQPYIVAVMTEALELGHTDRVLEIGTGSGYAAAVLAEIADTVYTIERHAQLAATARANLRRSGYENVHVMCADGTLGWAKAAPFDAIVVTAGGPRVPGPLLDQLDEGGRLVIPVGSGEHEQELVRVRRIDDELAEEPLGPVRFVPLVGAEGWSAGGRRWRKKTRSRREATER